MVFRYSALSNVVSNDAQSTFDRRFIRFFHGFPLEIKVIFDFPLRKYFRHAFRCFQHAGQAQSIYFADALKDYGKAPRNVA